MKILLFILIYIFIGIITGVGTCFGMLYLEENVDCFGYYSDEDIFCATGFAVILWPFAIPLFAIYVAVRYLVYLIIDNYY